MFKNIGEKSPFFFKFEIQITHKKRKEVKMRKKLTAWKKAYKIAYLVLMTLLNLRNADAEAIIERKIKAISKILEE